MNTTKNIVLAVAVAAIAIVTYGVMGGSLFNADAVDDHRDAEEVAAYEIYPGDVAEKIKNKENFILLDVRTPEEYAQVHLENAILLPVQELSAQTLAAAGIGAEMKDAEIIVYCRSGARSETAYNILHSLGYTNVRSVSGGMVHWEEDQFPFTVSGAYKGVVQKLTGSGTGENTTGPQIVLSKNFHDFGAIREYGGVVQTEVVVTNTGSDTLTIGDITTSCSCTSATISSKAIVPGGQATLTVLFDPDFHEEPVGVFKRTVFIPTNDATTPEAEVVVQVDILEGE